MCFSNSPRMAVMCRTKPSKETSASSFKPLIMFCENTMTSTSQKRKESTLMKRISPDCLLKSNAQSASESQSWL